MTNVTVRRVQIPARVLANVEPARRWVAIHRYFHSLEATEPGDCAFGSCCPLSSNDQHP